MLAYIKQSSLYLHSIMQASIKKMILAADSVIAILDPYSDEGRYAVKMWRHALAMLQTPGAVDGSGAVPYVPPVVDELLGSLTEDHAVLDVGCLGGYGLFDFTVRRLQAGAVIPLMTGVDAAEESIALAQHMVDQGIWAGVGSPNFLVARAEVLPFPNASYDVVIARLLLPYVDVAATLAECRRGLKPGGHVLFQLHASGYYWQRVWKSRKRLKWVVYYLRPLLSGWLCRVTGRQIKGRWWREMALSPKTFGTLAQRYGFDVVRVLGDARRPMVVCVRGKSEQRACEQQAGAQRMANLKAEKDY